MRWFDVQREADILSDRINGLDDWPADPHIVATGVAVETADLPAFKVAAYAGISVAADAALSPAPHWQAWPRNPCGAGP